MVAARLGGISSLKRYSQWDGTQKRKSNSADDIMSALADDVLMSGNINYALQRLIGAGFGADQLSQFQSLREILQQLLQQRRQKLQQYNIDSVFDQLKEQLDEVLRMERETIAHWLEGKITPEEKAAQARVASDSSSAASGESNFTDAVFVAIAQGQEKILDELPNGFSDQVSALQKYDFLNPDAQRLFLKLLEQLRNIVNQSFFSNITKAIDSLSEQDIERMKSMVNALSEMLIKHIQGQETDFEQFMQEYGDMFDDPPEDLQSLLDQIESQMANMQSLMNSLSPEQRKELEALMEQRLGDPELQQALRNLYKELSFLSPSGQNYGFGGNENIDLDQAMKLMDELSRMDRLEEQIRGVHEFSDLETIDQEALADLLGEETAEGFQELRETLRKLEEAGYIKQDGKRWEMTSRGSRIIGQKALGEIYQQLKNQGLGHHKTHQEGRFGDRQEETKSYEFGDSFDLHIPKTLRNALQRQIKQAHRDERQQGQRRIDIAPDDFELYRNELNTRTATVLLLDLSLSMEMRGSFLSAKKVTIALHNLISTQFPRDSLDVIGFSAYAKPLAPKDLMSLEIDQFSLGTNIQHALDLAYKKLAKHPSGTKQIIMISDGEPTSHMERGQPFFSYPPHPKTIHETLKAVKRCTQKDIAINTFMLDQNPQLMQFMNQLAKINGGRVFYTSPEKLGEYILHDYVENKRKRLGGKSR